MSRSYQRIAPVDHLVIDGESIVLYEDRFVRLGPLGTCLLTAAETPQTIDELAAVLIEAFGAPTQESALDATRGAVADLVAQGVLREADGD